MYGWDVPPALILKEFHAIKFAGNAAGGPGVEAAAVPTPSTFEYKRHCIGEIIQSLFQVEESLAEIFREYRVSRGGTVLRQDG
jgi:hypothetical protein